MPHIENMNKSQIKAKAREEFTPSYLSSFDSRNDTDMMEMSEEIKTTVHTLIDTAYEAGKGEERGSIAEGIKGIKWQLSNDLSLEENQLIEQLNLLDRVEALTQDTK